ncbi:MAG: competence/damage-inducible protein A [Candidatus Melainabacteria bacterium]|nr:competence/damage-inducible protein A [Candidatus Melainabacteria bacterium]
MKAEIISIGTELLLGQILNTNARFFASELQELGIESYFQTTVGDNTERIHEVLAQALKRADLILTTGGLGPTSDDLTHEAISSFFNVKLIKDKKVLKQIEKKFYLRGYKKMPGINTKQAYKPKDAKWIPNKLGTANGIIRKIKSQKPKIIMTFPGVPKELIHMWNETAKPYLKRLSEKNVIYSRTLKYTGIGESALAEKIEKYFDLKNPTVAPYAATGEVKIRITAKAKSISTAKKLVNNTANKILTKTKKYYFGSNEDTLEGLVASKLISKKKTISTAESCTGGLLSKRLTDIPGSSKYIKFNAITYSNESKNKILQVPLKIIKKHGAVSPETASSMALGIKKLSKTHIGMSITGIAGPDGGSKEKPVGLVYFGLAIGEKVKTQKVLFGSNSSREEIRWLATQFALNWLRKEL